MEVLTNLTAPPILLIVLTMVFCSLGKVGGRTKMKNVKVKKEVVGGAGGDPDGFLDQILS